MPKGCLCEAASTDQIRNNLSVKIVTIMDYTPLNKTGHHKSIQTKVEKPGRHYLTQAGQVKLMNPQRGRNERSQHHFHDIPTETQCKSKREKMTQPKLSDFV